MCRHCVRCIPFTIHNPYDCLGDSLLIDSLKIVISIFKDKKDKGFESPLSKQ